MNTNQIPFSVNRLKLHPDLLPHIESTSLSIANGLTSRLSSFYCIPNHNLDNVLKVSLKLHEDWRSYWRNKLSLTNRKKNFLVPRNMAASKIDNDVIFLPWQLPRTLAITNFYLFLKKLWWSFSFIFVIEGVFNAQVWEVMTRKNIQSRHRCCIKLFSMQLTYTSLATACPIHAPF